MEYIGTRTELLEYYIIVMLCNVCGSQFTWYILNWMGIVRKSLRRQDNEAIVTF